MDHVEIKGRMDLARGRRRGYEEIIQEISDFAMPFRGDITTKTAPGDDILTRNIGVFDSTATLAADQFANFLKSTIFPSSQPWMRLGLNEPFDQNVQARAMADVTARRMHRAVATSNFYSVVDQWVADTGVLGTGTFYGEDFPPVPADEEGSTFAGFRFQAVPWGRMYFLMGMDFPTFIMRERDITAIDAEREFKNPGAQGRKLIKEGSPMEMLTYVNVQWFNENGIPGGLRAPLEKPWVSLWILENSDDGGIEILRTRGQDLPSYQIARWMVRDAEEQGRGQGHIARPDMKGVNKLKELVLDAAGVDLRPPFLVENETQIDLDLGPDGLVVVTPPVKFTPQFLATGARYDVANQIGVEDRGAINKAFLADLIGDPETQDRSALAVRSREIRAAQRLAPRADQIYHEMVMPIVQFIMSRMSAAGALPELNDLFDLGVRSVDIEAVSPFFTAQKEAPLTSMQGWIEQWTINSQNTQRLDILDRIDFDKAVKLSAQLSNIPAEILVPDVEFEQIRADRAQQQAQQQQLDQVEQLATAAGRAAPALKAQQ